MGLPLPTAPLRPTIAATVLLGGGLLAGGLLAGDLLHGTGSALLLTTSAGLVALWLGVKRGKPSDRLPSTQSGLLSHCRGLIAQFEALGMQVQPRQVELQRLEALGERQERHVLLVGAAADQPLLQRLQSHYGAACTLQLHQAKPLPPAPASWQWPLALQEADQVLYLLAAEPTAADLRWIQAAPADLPLLVLAPQVEANPEQRQQLLAQWGVQLGEDCRLAGGDAPLPLELIPLARQRRLTQLRCLRALQQRWQGLLESERRLRLQPLVRRSQWLVAAAVFASPLPSADLLVLTAVNGLMLREMAQLWQCDWTAEQLRSAAVELGRTALGLGALEWGSQALAGILKLHGSTWLVGGGLQALTAAYFTRVVARSMADYLALAAGVAEADLRLLQPQLPLLVARAAEQERLDWPGFADQARQWWQEQLASGSAQSSAAL
jgi:uncharacterized protein (DUF697 family)